MNWLKLPEISFWRAFTWGNPNLDETVRFRSASSAERVSQAAKIWYMHWAATLMAVSTLAAVLGFKPLVFVGFILNLIALRFAVDLRHVWGSYDTESEIYKFQRSEFSQIVSLLTIYLVMQTAVWLVL